MAAALVPAWITRGLAAPGDIMVSSPSGAAAIGRLGVQATTDNAAVVAHADVLVLAVKPHILGPALAAVRTGLRPGTLVVSIVTGVTVKNIQTVRG